MGCSGIRDYLPKMFQANMWYSLDIQSYPPEVKHRVLGMFLGGSKVPFTSVSVWLDGLWIGKTQLKTRGEKNGFKIRYLQFHWIFHSLKQMVVY